MPKIDLTKLHPEYYKASDEPVIVDFEPAHYLTATGHGAPGGKEFHKVLSALAPMAYGIKKEFRERGQDFIVPKLEGLWWKDDASSISVSPPDAWSWKLLIRMPSFVSSRNVEAVRPHVVKARKNSDILDVRFEQLDEGRSAQVLHVGPYATISRTADRLRAHLEEQGFSICGPLHEVYLSDARKAAPQKLRTIVRYPIG